MEHLRQPGTNQRSTVVTHHIFLLQLTANRPIAPKTDVTEDDCFNYFFGTLRHIELQDLPRDRFQQTATEGLPPTATPLQVGLPFSLTRHAHLELTRHHSALQLVDETELWPRLRRIGDE